MDIDDWRKNINEIDEKILRLLNERVKCVINIGKIKKQRGLPLYSAEREDEIFNLLLKENEGPLEEKSVKSLFKKIVDESKRIERKYCD